MDVKEIIKTLNYFYSLELNQVDLYTAQSKSVNDRYIKTVLERVAIIEQQHVDNIGNKIKEFGGKPSVIGDVLAPIMGKVAGEITSWSGIVNMLKADIELEKIAMAHYKDFIIKAGKKPDLFNLLWSNLADEDLHTAWFVNKMEELQRQGY